MKTTAVTVLLAAPQQAAQLAPALLAAGRNAGKRQLQLREAATTGGAYRVLVAERVALMILEPTLPVVELEAPGLVQAATQGGAVVVTPEEFLAEPEAWLTRVAQKQRRQRGPLILPLRLALTSYSGGTGKTSVGWALAQAAARLHVPVALVELAWGDGALAARLGLEAQYPDLYRVATAQAEPQQVAGVTVVPIRETTWRLLLGNPDQVRACLEQLAQSHVLTIVDVAAGHPLYPVAEAWAQQVAVFTDSRPEATINARLLLETLGPRGVLVVNRANVQDRVALRLTRQQAYVLPEGVTKAGNALLTQLYPG